MNARVAWWMLWLMAAPPPAAASLPDGGVDCDAPYVHDVAVLPTPDGGVAVCLDEHTAVCQARRVVSAEVERDELRASLLRTDPSPVTVALWATGAALVTAGAILGALAGTGHLR